MTRLAQITIALFSSLPVLAASAAAQGHIWIVDDDGGVGVAFTDIGAAISAAADGDLIVVRDGVYPGFTLLGRRLSLTADLGATPTVGPSLIEQTTADERVVIRGLRFASPASSCSAPGVYVDFASGRNWFEDVSFRGCKGLWLNGSTVGTTTAIRCTTDPLIGEGVLVQNGATLHLLESTAQGADNVAGGHGLGLLEGTVIADGSILRGGAGAFGSCVDCGDGGPGANGLQQFAGTLFRRESTLQAGDGGPACCPPGSPGPVGLDENLLGGSLFDFPGVSRSLEVSSPVFLGGSSTMQLEGEAGDLLFLLVNTEQRASFIPGLGSLLLDDGFTPLLLGPSATGQETLSFSFPSIPPGSFRELFVQLGAVGTDGALGLGSASVLHVLGIP